MKLWELETGDTFTAPIPNPYLMFEVTDFIINHRGQIETVLVNIAAHRDGDGWLTADSHHHISMDPQATVWI